MALSRAEIQRRSNEKNGRRSKSYILDEDTIVLIDELAEKTGLTKGALIAEMAEQYARTLDVKFSG